MSPKLLRALLAVVSIPGIADECQASGTTSLVSVDSATTLLPCNGICHFSSMNADASVFAFQSIASDIIPSGDTNSSYDIFVKDEINLTMTRISVSTGGTQGNHDSLYPIITPSGSFVLFTSSASNLVAGDTNSSTDVFRHDLSGPTTTLVSVVNGGGFANGSSLGFGISDNGNLVSFSSVATNLVTGDTNGVEDIFLRNISAATTTRIMGLAGAQPNGASSTPKISGDGSTVVFASLASNLVASDTNAAMDVFAVDLASGTVTLLSQSTGGTQGNNGSFCIYGTSVSTDGRFVTFCSSATNLVASDTNFNNDAFLRDRTNGTTIRVSVNSSGVEGSGSCLESSVSSDGRFVSFVTTDTSIDANDTNSELDVYMRDTVQGTTKIVSQDGSGNPIGGMFHSMTQVGSDVTWSGLLGGSSDAQIVHWRETQAFYATLGVGTAGTGSFVPTLTGSDGFANSLKHEFTLSNFLGGASGFIYVSTASAAVWLPTYAATLHVNVNSPYYVTAITIVDQSGTTPGAGTGVMTIPGADLTAFAGLELFFQALVSDSAATGNVAFSEGLWLRIL